jgi:hypothetical protein
MTTKPRVDPSQPAPYVTVEELMAATGKGEKAVKAAIRAGQLPGYLISGVGIRNAYVIPRKAFQDWQDGIWMPVARVPERIEPRQRTGPVELKRKAS